jgi:low temperature requirement protein LtrA
MGHDERPAGGARSSKASAVTRCRWLVLFTLMLFTPRPIGLVMAATSAAAHAGAGLAFALCCSAIQVARTAFVLANLPG